GVLMKLNDKGGWELRFIMGVGIMLGGSGLCLLKDYEDIEIGDIGFYILGFLGGFSVGVIAMKKFLDVIKKMKLIPFGIY
ncbi:undecaprenyl-diphosphate phosphatase, partial [Staphylococcus aureus]|uniref:undecaprenyl-diphosphate phosphatase n=1 Tax=Staphylococcus aureus TaxID=1280 RepID=UPI0028CBBCA3